MPECAFTSPVIIELGMLVMYCMQFVMSVRQQVLDNSTKFAVLCGVVEFLYQKSMVVVVCLPRSMEGMG